MSSDTIISYATPTSYTDSSFFTELSNIKLNISKLDTSYQDIIGFYNYTALGSNQPPNLNISEASFKEKEQYCQQLPRDTYFLAHGKLFNVNSITEFKNLDKKALLTDTGLKIFNKIKDKSFIHDTTVLSNFLLLSFADLKKYKFYFWYAFPQFKSDWRVESIKRTTTAPSIQESPAHQFHIISESNELVSFDNLFDYPCDQLLKVSFVDTCSYDNAVAYVLRNLLFALAYHNYHRVEVQVFKYNKPDLNFTVLFENNGYNHTYPEEYVPLLSGWERTSKGQLGPKLADLGSLINPIQLADQAIDLNLKLMKWRLAPGLNLQTVKDSRVLILGSGTLGSYTARCLLAWGVRTITFVDNGKVSFSNPVRQPLFNYEDCLNGGQPKAETAATNLKKIFPNVDAKGYTLEIPMIGHPVKNEQKEFQNFRKLSELVDDHDAIFLLLDSREARWLPTVMGYAKNKIVINAALGFDSYLVMRHGSVDPDKMLGEQAENRLGCYYCNDIVAPKDSLTDRSLDQMCTVTRPGGALMAASLATELFVSVLQSPLKQHTPHIVNDKSNILGCLPHQIRGFLNNYETLKLNLNNFKHCTACSVPIIAQFNEQGWSFVKQALNDNQYLETLTGLKEFHEQAERAAILMEDIEDFGLDDDDDDDDDDDNVKFI